MFFCSYMYGRTTEENQTLPTFEEVARELPPLSLPLPFSGQYTDSTDYRDIKRVVHVNPAMIDNVRPGAGYVMHFESRKWVPLALHFPDPADKVTTPGTRLPLGSLLVALHCHVFHITRGSPQNSYIVDNGDGSVSEDYGTDDHGTDDHDTDDYGTDDNGTVDNGTDDYDTDDNGTDSHGTDDYDTDDYGTDAWSATED